MRIKQAPSTCWIDHAHKMIKSCAHKILAFYKFNPCASQIHITAFYTYVSVYWLGLLNICHEEIYTYVGVLHAKENKS